MAAAQQGIIGVFDLGTDGRLPSVRELDLFYAWLNKKVPREWAPALPPYDETGRARIAFTNAAHRDAARHHLKDDYPSEVEDHQTEVEKAWDRSMGPLS